MSVVCGICINGSQTGTLAVTTVSYPSDIRGTGIGWAYAVAKIGAMGAPAIGGVMLSRNWSVSRICSVQALVGIFVSIVILLLELQVAAVARRARKAAAKQHPSGSKQGRWDAADTSFYGGQISMALKISISD